MPNVNCDILCKWLSLYTAEARKPDGSEFAPKGLHLLLTGSLRNMSLKNPNFLDISSSQLQLVSLYNAMDNVHTYVSGRRVQPP